MPSQALKSATARVTSAAFFGLCDVMITAWAERFAPLTFLTISSLVVGLLTLLVWIIQGREKILPARGPRGWTIAGGVIVAG